MDKPILLPRPENLEPMIKRTILASCDTIKKRGLVATRNDSGENSVKEVVTHCIFSVFCRPEYRGKGYASKMMEDLRLTLKTWDQNLDENAIFTMVYSDIGKVCRSKLPLRMLSLTAIRISMHVRDGKRFLPVISRSQRRTERRTQIRQMKSQTHYRSIYLHQTQALMNSVCKMRSF